MSATTSKNGDFPFVDCSPITGNDTVALTRTTSAIYIGGGGNINVQFQSGNSAIFTGLAIGTFLKVNATKIWQTGTTANNLIALYQ